MRRRFLQVDVFSAEAFFGNPVAVVLDADGLDEDVMRRVANWTNLSETTFVLPPTTPEADYRVRIFTPVHELPFAGHPTLGTCHAWSASGGVPQRVDRVVQECAAGLITIRDVAGRRAFAAPPLVRSGPIEPALLAEVLAACRLTAADVIDSAWIDNGPGWLGVLVADHATLLAARPDPIDQDVGLIAVNPGGDGTAIEVRAFFPKGGTMAEDPVTGSLNASIAQWLLGNGRLTAPYVAAQGSRLGRRGRVHVSEADGEVWIGGDTVTCIEGTIDV